MIFRSDPAQLIHEFEAKRKQLEANLQNIDNEINGNFNLSFHSYKIQ